MAGKPGKGPSDANGAPTDWVVEFRIHVPSDLEPTARRLVEQLSEHLDSVDSSEV